MKSAGNMSDRRRTNAQNDFMWPMLRQIADGLNKINAAHIERVPRDRLTADDMKDYLLKLFSDELVGEQLVFIPNLMVVRCRRMRTSKLHVQEFAQFLEFCLAWAANLGLSVMVPEGYQQWSEEQRNGSQ